MPPAAFNSSVRRYARWATLAQFGALAEQVRHPTAAVAWPRRVGFALWLALLSPFMFAYLTLVRPGQLRAQHEAERLREALPR